MTIGTILLPVFVEVALIFALLGGAAKLRQDAMAGGTRERDVVLDGSAFPRQARQFANAYANQFEMPLLFLAAVILAIVVRQAGTLFVILEWLFVIVRIAHAGVHVTTNRLRPRGLLFITSAAVTACLWLLIAAGVLFPAL